eukprot:scaffold396_cov127-Isochrysis_galbana.AAC.2
MEMEKNRGCDTRYRTVNTKALEHAGASPAQRHTAQATLPQLPTVTAWVLCCDCECVTEGINHPGALENVTAPRLNGRQALTPTPGHAPVLWFVLWSRASMCGAVERKRPRPHGCQRWLPLLLPCAGQEC